MKKNAYVNYLVSELSSHLYRMADKERQSYYDVMHSMTAPGLLVNYKSTHIKDFFDFYIKELEFTPQDFVNSLNDDKRLMEVLYSQYYSFLSDRAEIQEIFESVIRQNPKLFLLALNQCLDTHHNTYEHAEKNPDNKETLAQIERGTNEFKNLLEIGEYENMFRKIPRDALYTKNSLYKNLIQEKGLLEDEAFDENKLINLFDEVSMQHRNRNFEKVSEYCMFYIKDIVEKFDSPSTFNAWAATHINNKVNADGKTIELMGDKEFFSLITREVNGESKDYQSQFIDRWIENPILRNGLTTGYSSDLSFLKAHPHKITTFLSKLSDEDKLSLLERGRNEFDFNRGHYGFVEFINKIPLENASPIYHAEIIEKLVDFRKSRQNSDDVMTDNAFFSVVVNHLVAKSLKIISSSSLPDEEKSKAKMDVLNVYVNNSDIMISLIHNATNSISKNIHNLENNLKELRLNKKDMNLSSNFFDDLESLATMKLEYYFDKQRDPNSHNRMKNLIEGISNSIKVVSALGIYSALDNLDLVGIKIDKEITVSGSKGTRRTKTLYDYPAIFEIVENTGDRGILSWAFQENHIVKLKEEALYKNKNIVEYFAAMAEDYRGSKPTIEKMFEIMMENKPVFKELVLSKKKTMKAVQELNNEFINLSLTVADLDNSLFKNEPVKKTSNKL